LSHGIYSALSGAVAQEASLEQTAESLANASTGGYRCSRPVFHEILGQAGAKGKEPPLRFAAMAASTLDVAPGDVRETGRALDVALDPSDFLVVRTPRGDRYTRRGALTLGPDGSLQGPHGAAVLGEDSRPIKLAAGAVATIDPDGTVRAGGAAAGRLRLVTFAKPELMVREGESLLDVGGAGAPTVSAKHLRPGALEGSNASPIRGMTELMRTTRLFEAFQRTIEAFHDADRKVVTTVPSR
jgi:flagellar basal-body rod protein FlgF